MTQSRIPAPEKTHRPYYNPAYLLKIYLWMETYRNTHGFGPSNQEMVEAKLASSTSVIRYYYNQMQKLNLIEVPTVTVNGRTFCPARGILLLPLDRAAPSIQELLTPDTSLETNP